MGLMREINVLRGVHHLAPVLARSTGFICKAVADWIRAEKGQALGRFGLLALVGFVTVRLCAPHPWTWAAAVGVWFLGCCALAARRGDFVHEAAPANDHETLGEQPTQPAPPSTPEADRERKRAALLKRVEEEVAAAVQQGGKGVRIGGLLDSIQADGSLPGWDTARLKELLKAVGVPLREQMHFRVNEVKTNQPGVHVDDLARSLGHSPRLPAHLVPDLSRTEAPAGPPAGPPTSPSHGGLTLVPEPPTEGVA